jgi:hypothetical protein
MIMTIITTWISTRHEDLPRPPRNRPRLLLVRVDGALRRRGLIGMSSARGKNFRLIAGRACVLNLQTSPYGFRVPRHSGIVNAIPDIRG